MKYFLLVYDTKAGRLVSLDEYDQDQRDKALADRLRLERDHMKAANIEVVVLGAESTDALARTHSRYFKSVPEHLDGIRKAAS